MNDDDTTPEPEPEDHELGELLRCARAVPAAGFRGALGRYLAARDPGYGPRPARLRITVAAFLVLGAGLLVVAALGATGAL